MLWPTVLKEQDFDEQRENVEAPFRRAYADKQPLSIDDYRMVIAAVGKNERDDENQGTANGWREIRRRHKISRRSECRRPKTDEGCMPGAEDRK